MILYCDQLEYISESNMSLISGNQCNSPYSQNKEQWHKHFNICQREVNIHGEKKNPQPTALVN